MGLGAIEDILQSYKEEDDYIKKTESLNFAIGNIEREAGYRIFIDLYGIIFIPDKEDTQEQSFYISNAIAPLFKVIVQMPDKLDPSFPWGDSVNNLYLYTKEVEDNYQLLTDEVKTLQVNFGQDKFFRNIKLSSLHQEVLGKMQDPNFSVRASEIYYLYVSLLIADDINLPFTDEFVEADFGPNYEYNTFEHVKMLFKTYYEKIKKDITPVLSVDDPLWNELLNKVEQMGDRIKYIKNFYGEKLSKLLSENKIDEICHEIDRFMKMNFEDRKIIPTKKEIEDNKIKGGPKLIKRILGGDGYGKKGFDYFRDQYSLFLERLERQIEFVSEEKEILKMTAPSEISIFAKKYENFIRRTENQIKEIIGNVYIENGSFDMDMPEIDASPPISLNIDESKLKNPNTKISKKTTKSIQKNSQLKVESKIPRFNLAKNELPELLPPPFNFVIEDKFKNQNIGVISSPSRNLSSSNFQSLVSQLKKYLLRSKSSRLNFNSKVVIICDFNPSDEEIKNRVNLIKNNLKKFGLKNIFLISIIKVDSLKEIIDKKLI